MSDDTNDLPEPPEEDGYDPRDPEFAKVEDLTVRRDEGGELLPVTEETMTLGKVRVRPMPYGAIEKHFGEAAEVSNVDSDVIAKILDEYVDRPDLREAAGGVVTGEWVRDNLKPLVPRDLILAILSASDVDADVMMGADGSAQVALETDSP